MMLLWVFVFVLSKWVDGVPFDELNVTEALSVDDSVAFLTNEFPSNEFNVTETLSVGGSFLFPDATETLSVDGSFAFPNVSFAEEFLFDDFNETEALPDALLARQFGMSAVQSVNDTPVAPPISPMMVARTCIEGAAAKGAVCLDGTLPAYHFDKGYGAGVKNWLVNLEGGGWCNNIRNCVYRKKTRRGSSTYMEKEIPFTGILSRRIELNPDFFNWNRVKIRYCDGASFKGEGQDEAEQLLFRGQRIWKAAMEELMSLGMVYADRVLLSGCSAGGLATILHCDEFRELFPASTQVKCLSDAGLFLDAVDVSGGRTLRSIYEGVVSLQGVAKNLPSTCTSQLDPTSCFFPENLVDKIKTPLFLLNSAYDAWQIQDSLAPKKVDPNGYWRQCTLDISKCNASELEFLLGFRNEMLDHVKNFTMSKENALFLNSCFSHCQTDRQDTWFANNSPRIGNKTIAEAVGDWYFERAEVKAIDCPYPCDKTCRNLVFLRQLNR